MRNYNGLYGSAIHLAEIYAAGNDDKSLEYMNKALGSNEGVWETNIFGKTIAQLVQDGIQNKIAMIGEESQQKLQDTMQKIVNDSNGGLVCIII